MAEAPPSRVPVGDAFAGKGILLLGSTGFLGKVCLGMLLKHFPQVRRIYVMVRAPGLAESRARFADIVGNSPALQPLRDAQGDRLEAFLEEKVVVLGGDITLENLGYSDDEAGAVAADIDLVLNCSGRVTFNPPLEAALSTNVHGTRNVIAFARRMKRPALIHTSTCFVAGNRAGEIREDEPLIGYFPRRDREDQEFRVDLEISDCERLAARVRDEAQDKSRHDAFVEAARTRFRDEGRDPSDARALKIAIATERKEWIRRRLRDLGIEKAEGWGWPNIYTYTKSLGDQLVAGADGIVRSIVRPAIVESALSFPEPGWNEGFTTSAPLVRMALRGQNVFPVDTELVLDVVPVDMVASATLAVAAEALVGEPRMVYQVSSGDRNPARIGRIVDLVGLYKRQYFQERPTGPKAWNEILGRMEAQAISAETFEKHALDWIRKATSELGGFLDEAGEKPLGPLGGAVRDVQRRVRDLDRFVEESERHYRTFKPFIAGEKFIFRADNTHDLFSRLEGHEGKLHFAPQELDWYDYWLHVHLPGLQRWVFPTLDEQDRARPKRVYAYRSLNELFDACTRNHAGRVAMRITRNGREERYTYADFRECVLRGAAFLAGRGLGPGDHVALIGDNAPEWGMAWFAIQRIGAVAIPLERDLRASEAPGLLAAGDAKALLVGDSLLESRTRFADGIEIPAHRFSEIFAVGDEVEEAERIAALPEPAKGSSVASILFTSGTTGAPKGVMLTHRNFTSLVAKLLSVYDIGDEDGALSVLPLHHSFEFTAGFLLPLSRGAQIAYLDELSPESLTRELKKGHTTCMVGVPALWDLLRRRILAPFRERSSRAEDLMVALIDALYLLRDDTGVNLGPAIFLPVHTAFGGRLRHLISGASAISEATWKTFRGLGFQLAQGYGLTEAAPVLTVTAPNGRVPLGSAGTALPGISLKIRDKDASGVGEVMARGSNIMAGYYKNPEATAEALTPDGWLATGDLGRLDENGHLFLVGRRKEVIVDSGGKNVYPEEIEDIHAAADLIEEMAVLGLPDGTAEQVAAVVVPKDGVETERIEAYFREVGATLPIHKRIKTFEFRDEALPRTATRKVRRAELARWLADRRKQAAAERGKESGSADRLTRIVARVAERPESQVRMDSTFAELGFDSLMYNELAAALEAEFGQAVTAETLAGMATLAELPPGLRGAGKAKRPRARREEDEIRVPPAIQQLGRTGLAQGQRWLYEQLLDTSVTGRNSVPVHTHFIVAANHGSHLDTGLVRRALGDAAANLVTLAAADYFFDNRIKRTFFENFTSLVPMERRGSLRDSLDAAARYLETGHNVLIFPEGTRSRSGEIATFRRGFAHLAFRCGVGVLPVHLDTWRAFPPGAVTLQARKVSARIGPFLSPELLGELADGRSGSAAEHRVARLVQTVVERLGRNEPIRLDEEVQRLRGAGR